MSLGQDLFVVGIGSSAGGIEALEGLFRPMPENSGMAFVLVSHLAPDRESRLHEIVGRFTAMPVVQASDGMALERDHVYVISPDGTLELAEGRLRVVSNRDGARHPNNAIDVFLTSLAADRGDRAIGVLLSGAGSDGTVGFAALKEGGGLTLAQGRSGSDGAPRHTGMPDSAVGAGLVDIVAPVEQMPDKLLAYVRDFGAVLAEVVGEDGRPADRAEAAKREICAILRGQVGHDFEGYKPKTFLRRVQRRMQVLQLVGVQGYIERLRTDPDEVTLLFRDLLIGVTTFFRDEEAFAALAATVLPKLVAGKGADDTVRVWVAGCATGEEVYSIAILLREQLKLQRVSPKVQIFGTDIDERALNLARAGRYGAGAVGQVSPERLRRFFTEDSGWFVLSKEVREMCIFSQHSIVRDPPFSRIDLISCRNLLIYLDAQLQSQVIPVFHYALRPGGYLFLGSSENVTQHEEAFAALDKKLRIFRRLDSGTRQAQVPMLLPGPRFQALGGGGHRDQPAAGAPLRRAVDARVLERFAPAHVVVNREGEVVYYSQRTGKYLEQAAGMPSRQLLGMARKGLRLELRGALHEAMETRHAVARANIAVEIDERVQRIDLLVEPLVSEGSETLFLVLFADVGPLLTPEDATHASPGAPAGSGMGRLEAELRDSRERLQSTIEEYETALEELKAANEELVSMNEELQSTNEELETSKEEIQSINEELQTLNHELATKLDQLNQANSDLANVLDSTQIAVVFLDRDLIIRSFTPAVTGIFSLILTDQGRPLTDIATSLDHDGLADDVRQVLSSGEVLERRVARRGGSAHYLMRILPYQVGDGTVSGVLVTFVDVTVPVQAEQRQRLLVHELNHRVRNMLAVVSSIASQTLARTPEPEAFAASFLGRVQALARSHALLARDQWGHIGLAELLGGELAPYIDDAAGRVSLEGPAVQATPKAALALGLVAHELATNAMKHGALSAPAGRVRVTWAITSAREGGRAMTLRWEETNLPDTAADRRPGFGTVLVEREVKHELGGTLRREFGHDSLRLTIALPVDPLLVVTHDEAKAMTAAAS